MRVRAGQATARALDLWFAPIDARRLELFRRALALCFLLYTAAWFLNAGEWLTDAGFHYSAQSAPADDPRPLPTLPGWAVWPFGLVMFGSALTQIVGWQARRTIWLVLACAVYIQLVDLAAAFTINKLFIVGFLVIALSPRPMADPGGGPPFHSAWPVRVLQATLLIFYFNAGFCKAVYGHWLTDPNVLWTQAQGGYRTEAAAFLLNHVPQAGWSLMMYSALAFELLAPLLFLHRKLLWIGIAWGASFQLVVALTMAKLLYFSLQVMSFYLLFIDPQALVRLRGRMLSSVREWLPASWA